MVIYIPWQKQSLRDWARGDLALEAAIELLIRFNQGRLLRGPWIRHDEHDSDRWYFNAKTAVDEGSYLSGGERRVLGLAASLATSNRPVDLGDAITGIDHDALALVLEALAHAGGLPSSLTRIGDESALPREKSDDKETP